MRVGVLGINHKLANLELRELLAKACQRCFMSGTLSYSGHVNILLSTCNRTEIYFSSNDLAATHSYLLQMLRSEVQQEFDQKIYSYFGYDCFLHLTRVTAGLDSAIFAETEIQRQVKVAYETGANCINLPSELHYLFQKALKISKMVRAEFVLGRGMADLEHAIFQAGVSLFEIPAQSKILFVGASDVNCKVLGFLKKKNCHDITLCNRSLPRAQAIAKQYQVSTLEWGRICDWPQYHWIIFGTRAPHYLATKDQIPKECSSRKLVIDLCVPRNVDPVIGQRYTLLNIDQLNRELNVRKQQMASTISQVEERITLASQRHVESFRVKTEFMAEKRKF